MKPPRIVWSLLGCVALYNLHQIAGLFGVAPSNVLSQSNEGDVWTFVIDKAQMGAADLQRMGINLAFAQLALVALWNTGRAYGWAFFTWFAIQAFQIWATCNCSVAEHIDWIILAVLLGIAWGWYRVGPKVLYDMRVVWNKLRGK